jgi:chitinase
MERGLLRRQSESAVSLSRLYSSNLIMEAVSPARSHTLTLFLTLAALVLAGTPAHGSDVTAPHAPRGFGRIRDHRIVVGYFLGWAVHAPEPFYLRSLVTSGSAVQLDQINYSQASVQNGRCSLSDPNADISLTFTAAQSVNGHADNPSFMFRGNFHQLQLLKRRYPKLKVLISLEGSAADFALDAQPANREAFVASCVDIFIRGHFAKGVTHGHVFDGIDVDWESPHTEDAENFRALLEEFRRQMNAVRRGLRLSVAVGDSPRMLPGTDFDAVSKIVDQVGVMNYDDAGPWNGRTGFVAPLFLNPASPHEYSSSIERSIQSYEAVGVPAQKLLMGLPFYGYSWTGVSNTNNGLFQAGRGVRGDRPYRVIRALPAPFTVYRDPHSQAPWLYDGETFWTFEDPVSVRYKASYAATEHLGGVMIWELSGDTTDGELLSAAFSSLHHPLDASVFVTPSLMPVPADVGLPAAHAN